MIKVIKYLIRNALILFGISSASYLLLALGAAPSQAQGRSARPFEDPRSESTNTAKHSESVKDKKASKAAWSVSTADGSTITSRDLNGRPALLMFYRGMECPHCRRQLDALNGQRKAFKSRNIKVVAVSPFLPSADILKDTSKQLNMWYPLGADNNLAVFKHFGFADENNIPAHGVVLIDAEGHVLWKEAGSTANVDIEKILAECDSRLKKRGEGKKSKTDESVDDSVSSK